MKQTTPGPTTRGPGLLLGLARRLWRPKPAKKVSRPPATWTGAARAAADGAPRVAIAILEGARARVGLDGPGARLLIELHAGADDVERAVEVALDHLDLLDPEDVRNMIASLETWGERRGAATLAAAAAGQRTATTNSRGNGNRRLPSVRIG